MSAMVLPEQPLRLLRYGGLTEPQRKAINRISISSDRMARMINDLLDFTRARLGGGYPVNRARMNVHEVLRRVVEELEVAHPRARGWGWGSGSTSLTRLPAPTEARCE